jgi:hypothetical protein
MIWLDMCSGEEAFEYKYKHEGGYLVSHTNECTMYHLLISNQFKVIYIDPLLLLQHVSTAYCLSSSGSTYGPS